MQLERKLYDYLDNKHTFICPEVMIRSEIVDCLSYSHKKGFCCYELKISVSDFHSKNAKTLVGNYNYFVMPTELIDKVRTEIPDNIGIIENGTHVVKNPKKQKLKVPETVIYYSLFKYLYRDAEKYQKIKKSGNIDEIEQLRKQKNKEIARLKKKIKQNEDTIRYLERNYIQTSNMFRFLRDRAKEENIEEMKKGEEDGKIYRPQ